jgi:hypothetical protein
MSDEGSFSLPHEAIEKHKLATAPISSPISASFLISKIELKKMFTSNVLLNRMPAAMFDPVESLKKKETMVARVEPLSLPVLSQSRISGPSQAQPSNLCGAVKSNRGLDFKTPTSYLSSVLKKAGAVEKSEPLFKDHADLFWKEYLSKNNFEGVSTKHDDGDFNFDKLKNGTLIVLEKSCFKEGTVAVYCDGKYYATRFVKTESLLKKVNSKNSNCQLGSGMRLVVEKQSESAINTGALAKAH